MVNVPILTELLFHTQIDLNIMDRVTRVFLNYVSQILFASDSELEGNNKLITSSSVKNSRCTKRLFFNELKNDTSKSNIEKSLINKMDVSKKLKK